VTFVVTPTPDSQVIVVPDRRAGAVPLVWVHTRASIASRLLGGRAARAVFAPEHAIRSAMLTELDPARDGRAAALVEVSPDRFGRVADALARSLGTDQRGAFDIWHEVPLVQQLTGMSCWAAAAAMVVGWRDCVALEAEDVVAGAGHWGAYRDGLEPREVESFARTWGLVVARPADISVASLRELLERHGPLWVGEASPSLHVVVLAGMHGDGTREGTFVRIADPWPIGRGERYTIPFTEFRTNLMNAAALAGGRPQFLHTAPGFRRAGTRGSEPRPPAAWRPT
jgi:hypothetical protein